MKRAYEKLSTPSRDFVYIIHDAKDFMSWDVVYLTQKHLIEDTTFRVSNIIKDRVFEEGRAKDE